MEKAAALAVLLAAAGGAPAGEEGELAAPVMVLAGREPIDTEIGHAAPFVGDFDGDGKRDLLVGQFGGGTLWIYRNDGTDAAPVLNAREKFRAGGTEGTVPTG